MNDIRVSRFDLMKWLMIAVLLFGCQRDSYAQKWLKNIGKALDKVGQIADQLTAGDNGQTPKKSQSSSSKSTVFTCGDVKVATTLPNFKISVDKVMRTGKASAAIYLTITNTSMQDVRLYGLNIVKGLVDLNGNDYSGYGLWMLEIGEVAIKRYGTDDDYTFPSRQSVAAKLHIYGLKGKETVETVKMGSVMKTTTRLPSVVIQNFAMEPSIVYQQENLRRNYTLEITGVKIPAYVHIDREGINKAEDAVTGNNDIPTKQDAPKGSTGNNTPAKQDSTSITITDDNETAKWRPYIQPVLDRQTVSLQLRSDVHYTNEPRGDWRDGMRLTAISLSSAEYERFDGILFEYVDGDRQFKTIKARDIAQMYSSWPRKGTRCGIITITDKRYLKGMRKSKIDAEGIPVYDFVTSYITLQKVETVDSKVVNGVETKAIVFSAIETRTPFGIAYQKAIVPQKKPTETEHLILGVRMEYDKATKEWKDNGWIKYNPKTQKWEKWFIV